MMKPILKLMSVALVTTLLILTTFSPYYTIKVQAVDFEKIKGSISDLGDSANDKLNKAGDKTKEVGGKAKDKAVEVGGKAYDNASKAYDSASALASEVGINIKNYMIVIKDI